MRENEGNAELIKLSKAVNDFEDEKIAFSDAREKSTYQSIERN